MALSPLSAAASTPTSGDWRSRASRSQEEQLAFWINASDAQMLALVLDHDPIRGDDPAHPPASVLFSWFAGDFASFAEDLPALRKSTGEHAGAPAFAARHLPSREREAVLEGRLRVQLLPYDWRLNDSAAAAVPSR